MVTRREARVINEDNFEVDSETWNIVPWKSEKGEYNADLICVNYLEIFF